MVDCGMIKNPCDRGGLGIPDLFGMNATLLAKWVYRYANDMNHLWKRIVYTKSWTDPNTMLPIINRTIRKSILFYLLGTIMDMSSRVSSLITQEFRAPIGNGLNTDF